MSLGWFSSVIHTEPSSAMTVLPTPSTTLRVWFGPSRTAPHFSSSRIWLSLRLVCAACIDRKSTRLNSSHSQISYAVFCLKKKNRRNNTVLDLHPHVQYTAV